MCCARNFHPPACAVIAGLVTGRHILTAACCATTFSPYHSEPRDVQTPMPCVALFSSPAPAGLLGGIELVVADVLFHAAGDHVPHAHAVGDGAAELPAGEVNRRAGDELQPHRG